MTNDSRAVVGRSYSVLDHGSVTLLDFMGSDKAVVEAARTSVNGYGRNVYDSEFTDKDTSLLRYLKRHKHTSPFEMVELKFHCKMPIFVARQWVRHRTASINEISGRYSELKTEFFRPSLDDLKRQSASNNQGRSDEDLSALTKQRIVEYLGVNAEVQSHLYRELVDTGLTRELARIDLPLSTYTEWVWKIDLHNLMHFLTLRCDSHAQKEIREYGDVMAGILMEVCPESFEAWLDYEFMAVTFSRQEMEMIRQALSIRPIIPPPLPPFGMSSREFQEFLDKINVEPDIEAIRQRFDLTTRR